MGFMKKAILLKCLIFTLVINTKAQKTVALVEGFTGHYLSNAHLSQNLMDSLENEFQDSVIFVNLHAGDVNFTAPHVDGSGNPSHIIGNDTLYSTDFRTVSGTNYANMFQPFGLPTGMVSRNNNGNVLPITLWRAEISNTVQIPSPVEISISATYDSVWNILNVTANNMLTTDLFGDHYLVYYLVEDSVIDWQLVGGVHDPNYMHRHVLRGAMNSDWGDLICSGTTLSGTSINQS
ncbi:MAG: hypothetical protein COB15_14835 [Flavobacteriales bacterium]|nr:MAG: hypothetical protein COB15_14835 [Flavobacteriales bacterium]